MPSATGWGKMNFAGPSYRSPNQTEVSDRRRQGNENWTLDQWEQYAKSSSEGQRAWRGGRLSNQDYETVSWLQQQEAENEAKTAFDEAKTANETRYGDILQGYDERYSGIMKGYDDRYAQAMGTLQNLGNAERTDLRKTYAGLNASSMQTLVNSGMAGSTVAPSVRAHNTRRLDTAMGQLNDRLRTQQVGYQTSLSGQSLSARANMTSQKLGFMERRNDTYPQSYEFAKLMNQYGNYS